MAYTLVHCSDVHLETVFTELRGGARRRAALADAFVRIVDLACDRKADALTIGGDLFESARASEQTARFLAAQFARFEGPIFIAPGNHDPHGENALLARNDLPANVRIFREAAWSAFPLAEGLTLYGYGHTPAEPGRPFAGARFDRPGVRIALVHGSDEERCPLNKRATAPFTAMEVAASGATLLLTGHYHGGYVAEHEGRPLIAYPGSPEPIKFGERGTHGALVVRIDGEAIAIESVEIARTRLLDFDISVDGASSEHAIAAILEAALVAYRADDYVRARLIGTIPSGTRIDCAFLEERSGPSLGALELSDATVSADYDALAREPNVRGRVVHDLLTRAREGDADADVALRYVVAAFAGGEIAP